MKLSVLFSFILLSCMFASCSDDNPTPVGGGGNNNAGVVTVEINGQTWSAPDGYAERIQPFGMQLYAVNGPSSNITVYISPYNGIQSYYLDGNTRIVYNEGNTEYNSTNGQLNITVDNDQYVEGTFSCDMVSNGGSTPLSLTKGIFRLTRRQ